jgi:hypothetical protein
MSERPDKFKDRDEALLLERSRALVVELEELIERAKALTEEHRAVTDELKQRKKAK